MRQKQWGTRDEVNDWTKRGRVGTNYAVHCAENRGKMSESLKTCKSLFFQVKKNPLFQICALF